MGKDDVVKVFTAAENPTGLKLSETEFFRETAKIYGRLEAARDGDLNHYNGNAITAFLKLDPD